MNMKTSVEATGKNIEQAIENALFELKAPREDVDIKILSEGGLFKKAKVVVSISQDEIEKYQKREKLKEEEEKPKPQPPKPEPKPKPEKVQVKKQEKAEEQPKPQPKAKPQEDKIEATQFVEGLLKAFGKDAQVSEIKEDEVVKIEVSGENLNDLIGYRGETMFALSYLMNTICKRGKKKQVLDICDYREKERNRLKALQAEWLPKWLKQADMQNLNQWMPAKEELFILLFKITKRLPQCLRAQNQKGM